MHLCNCLFFLFVYCFPLSDLYCSLAVWFSFSPWPFESYHTARCTIVSLLGPFHRSSFQLVRSLSPSDPSLSSLAGAVYLVLGHFPPPSFCSLRPPFCLDSRHWLFFDRLFFSSNRLREEGSSSQTGSRTSFSSSPPTVNTVEIRLLPALPDDWPAGTFRGLRTRGGYEVDVEWNGGKITSGSLRPVTSNVAAAGENRGGRSASVEANPTPPCRVLSRTRLKAVVVVDDREVTNGAELKSDYKGVFEGGLLWYSVSVEALQPGEEAHFFPIGS